LLATSTRQGIIVRDTDGGERLPLPDQELLTTLVPRAIAEGGADVEELMSRVRVVAFRYCRARLATYAGGSELADDVAQEICIAVLRGLPTYQERGRPFVAWVYSIGAFKVADAQRRLHRDRSLSVAQLPEAPDESPTPEESALTSSDVRLAARLMESLPERLREVLVMRLAIGISVEQTALTLGMTTGAVRVAQHRAVKRLRTVAADLEEAEPETSGPPAAVSGPLLGAVPEP